MTQTAQHIATTIECRDFYELMQVYRHVGQATFDNQGTVAAYDAVIAYVDQKIAAHDDLVAALKLARAEITALEGRKPTDTDNSIVREINAALAKAGAE